MAPLLKGTSPVTLVTGVLLNAFLIGCSSPPEMYTQPSPFLNPEVVKVRKGFMEIVLQSKPSGVPLYWVDDTSGLVYTVVALRSYQRDETWCRLLEEAAWIPTDQRVTHNTIYCRDNSGVWRLTASG